MAPTHDHSETGFLLKDLLRAVYWFDEGLQAHQEAAGWPRMSRTKSMIMINLADGITRPIQIAQNLARIGMSRSCPATGGRTRRVESLAGCGG